MLCKHLYLLLSLLLTFGITNKTRGQSENLTLDTCHQLAKDNYPAIKKRDLITRTAEYDVENAGKRYLPQLTFSGQATYQSQTVDFSNAISALPGIAFPSISKDQYKIQGEVNQLLYDGGNIKNQKDQIKANAALQEQNIETNLYAIRQRINNLYFSILLIEAQLKQNELNKANLQTQVQKTEAALANGTAFRSSLDELKAEVVNLDMSTTEFKANRIAYLKMLSLFIGKELPANIQLQTPDASNILTVINRPELKAFELQKSVYDVARKQLNSDYLPQLSAFFQGAYGRPTLNIIDNNFGPWYVTGIRLNWSLSSLYTLSNRKNILLLNKETVEADRETFLLNTSIDLKQQDEQVQKYTELLEQDNVAIALRASVAKSSEAQLNNGIITTHEYIQKVNAEHLARQNKIIHEIQLLQARYNQKFISGN